MITAGNRNSAVDSINNCRSHIGWGNGPGHTSAGNTITAGDTNSLLNYTREIRNNIPGAEDVAINGDVGVGGALYDVYSHIISAVNASHNACTCHGNCGNTCTGSCTGSCSGSCTGGCTATCRDACSGTCGGCGSCGCNCGGCGAGGNKRISPLSPYYRFDIIDFINDDIREAFNIYE